MTNETLSERFAERPTPSPDATEAARAMRVPEWQPFDTAPRDGTRFLAFGGGLTQVESVAYNDRDGCWDAETCTLDDCDNESDGYSRPTIWQPTPEPPIAISLLPLPTPQPDEREADFDLVVHLERQRAFSLKTFGPGQRTNGVLDHITKELDEIRADPADIKEWVDVIILAFDGAWRAGWEPEDIVKAIVAKQKKNEMRVWPDWRTSDPNKAIEHDRSHDALASIAAAKSKGGQG